MFKYIFSNLGSMEDEEEIRVLQRGDYFGEQALLKEDCRTANIIAMHPGVECLTLDRESFKQLIGDLSEIKEKDYGDEQRFNRQINASYAEKQGKSLLGFYQNLTRALQNMITSVWTT
jgi:CRP-like cAMP-binding protein